MLMFVKVLPPTTAVVLGPATRLCLTPSLISAPSYASSAFTKIVSAFPVATGIAVGITCELFASVFEVTGTAIGIFALFLDIKSF